MHSKLLFIATALCCGNLAVAQKQPKTIWGTFCWEEKSTRASSNDCALTIAGLEVMADEGQENGLGGPEEGCKEIIELKGCGIELCNVRPAGTTVSYGAMIAAARIQHNICREFNDGTTGGITAVEGFEQFGQAHGYAEVHLANSALTGQHRDRVKRNSMRTTERSPQDSPKTGLQKRTDFPVRFPGSYWTLRSQWADWHSALEGDMSTRTQTSLIDRLVQDWNSDLGRGTERSARSQVRDGEGTWTLSFHVGDGLIRNVVPIVDRRPIIDAFFTFRRQEGAAHFGSPATMTTYLWNDDRDFVVGHFTLMFVADVPALPFEIEMPGMRGVSFIVNEFGGSG